MESQFVQVVKWTSAPVVITRPWKEKRRKAFMKKWSLKAGAALRKHTLINTTPIFKHYVWHERDKMTTHKVKCWPQVPVKSHSGVVVLNSQKPDFRRWWRASWFRGEPVLFLSRMALFWAFRSPCVTPGWRTDEATQREEEERSVDGGNPGRVEEEEDKGNPCQLALQTTRETDMWRLYEEADVCPLNGHLSEFQSFSSYHSRVAAAGSIKDTQLSYVHCT